MTHLPGIHRTHSKSAVNPLGQPLVIYVSGSCSCGWLSKVDYATQRAGGVEAWSLAERDANEHAAFAKHVVPVRDLPDLRRSRLVALRDEPDLRKQAR